MIRKWFAASESSKQNQHSDNQPRSEFAASRDQSQSERPFSKLIGLTVAVDFSVFGPGIVGGRCWDRWCCPSSRYVRPSESAGPIGLDQTLEYWLEVLYVPLAPLTVCWSNE